MLSSCWIGMVRALPLFPLWPLIPSRYLTLLSMVSASMVTGEAERPRKRVLQPWPAWFSLWGHHPAKGKVAVSIPGQGTHLGGCFRPEATQQSSALTSMFLSLSFSLPPPAPQIQNKTKQNRNFCKSLSFGEKRTTGFKIRSLPLVFE